MNISRTCRRIDRMRFFKYEATGNDFIMIDAWSRGAESDPDPGTVRRMCDRHRGVGADGVITLSPSGVADVRMRIINADGTDAEMCGNGVRALFLFALDLGVATGDRLTVETPAGIRSVARSRGRDGDAFTVGMGRPSWLRKEIPMKGEGDAIGVRLDLDGGTVRATCVSMGNPHCVVFVDDVDSYTVEESGRALERHPSFPERTNVEFVQVAGGGRVKARVWERGVGETMACGTGSCAILVAANLNGLAGRAATVVLPGGELFVEWREEEVLLTGPARRVFDGETVE